MSAVPDVLEALLALCASAAPSAQMVDGIPTGDIAGDLIAVGMPAQAGSPGVESTEEVRGLAAISETSTVYCLARSWSGNDDVGAQRTRTYALLSAVRAQLRRDNTLGATVIHARVAGSTYMPWRTDSGHLVVDVAFRVETRSLT